MQHEIFGPLWYGGVCPPQLGLTQVFGVFLTYQIVVHLVVQHHFCIQNKVCIYLVNPQCYVPSLVIPKVGYSIVLVTLFILVNSHSATPLSFLSFTRVSDLYQQIMHIFYTQCSNTQQNVTISIDLKTTPPPPPPPLVWTASAFSPDLYRPPTVGHIPYTSSNGSGGGWGCPWGLPPPD